MAVCGLLLSTGALGSKAGFFFFFPDVTAPALRVTDSNRGHDSEDHGAKWGTVMLAITSDSESNH